MPGKHTLGVAFVVASTLLAGCSQAPESPPAADSKAEDPKRRGGCSTGGDQGLRSGEGRYHPDSGPDQPQPVGDGRQARRPDGRGQPEQAVGETLATTPVGGLYRSAYQGRGIYLDIDKQSGKVIAIYVNSTLARKVKGRFRSILRRGNLELFKKMFGPEPRRLRPDLQTTSWRYPRKGVELIQTRSGDQRTYTFKLVRPRRG